MDFGQAFHYLKNKNKITRAGWPGKYLYISLGDPKTTDAGLPVIYELTTQGYHIPWVATQADLLALDWEWIK